MKRRLSGLAALLAAIGFAVGCAKRPTPPPPPPPPPEPEVRESLIILLPDDDGSVGQLEISNPSGTQSLTRAREAVEIKQAASGALGTPFEIDQSEIDQLFGSVIQQVPEPPARFILYFVSGSALTDDMKRTLDEVYQAVVARQSVDVSVIGHSDTSGAKDVNQRVSARRARAVADHLIALGVDPANLEVGSHGEENLQIPTPDNVVEPRNRRVEITVR